ncbi:MAG TPA: chromate resistance protein ChrB domain-containing protein [Thermoanaerobaculia bacterium]|nr:chromate resistance protein ChrB domain-containing protein [Thermoanaerobaculia bacterium]
MSRWLILVHRIPSRPLYLRAKMRQRLADVGAVAVKNSVYLLPYGTEALEDLQWIAQEIVAGGGEAHLFSGDFVDGVANEAAVAQFVEARNADYDAIAADAKAAMKAARSAAAVAELTAAHARLARRLEEVRTIDFFEADRRAASEEALAAIETRLQKDRKEETRMMKANPELRGRTWVTRPGVKVDRMASAWFIRRFVDPKARFRFADPAAAKRDGEVRFDMVGGDFTHEEDRCTFETLVGRIGLPDKGVRAIAEIVHDLDLKDAKFGRTEAAGVRMMLDGLMARTENDDERIERALVIFDDLHEALGSRTKRARK